MATQYTAQVCLEGHCTTDRYESSIERQSDFCPKCGSPTIIACQNCGKGIRGNVRYDGVIFVGQEYIPPSYCFSCGAAFPWTESAINAAIELAILSDELTELEIKAFQADIVSLAADNPKTQVAAFRTNELLKKVGSEIGQGIKSILIEIASEAAKKAMGLK